MEEEPGTVKYIEIVPVDEDVDESNSSSADELLSVKVSETTSTLYS